ncbi:hypothetical protein [Nitrosomonas sp.]|nr:hypothetical protein [Nitrosomonas sp.]
MNNSFRSNRLIEELTRVAAKPRRIVFLSIALRPKAGYYAHLWALTG